MLKRYNIEAFNECVGTYFRKAVHCWVSTHVDPTGDLIVNTSGKEMAVFCPSVSFVPYLRLALPPLTPIRALGGNSMFTLTPILK